MNIDNWDDIRTALAVARKGTVSAAAAELGVHHATVIRRVDALEAQFGTRLFQRRPRGYVPTEAGRALLATGNTVEARLGQMAAMIAGGAERIEGRLTITALPSLTSRILPRLSRLLAAHPALQLEYITDERLFRLDAGEAHIAIRAGARPSEPDYVVQSYERVRHALYAAPDYLRARGLVPGDPLGDPRDHQYILPRHEKRGAPFMRWTEQALEPANHSLQSNDPPTLYSAVRAGLGLGFLPQDQAEGMIEMMHQPEWDSILWLVTHVDLHRTAKVQAALAALKAPLVETLV